MNIWTPSGEKVVYIGIHGSDSDLKIANKLLTTGNVYVVESIDVHNWSTDVKLVGIVGVFNSVLFDNVEGFVPPDEKECSRLWKIKNYRR